MKIILMMGLILCSFSVWAGGYYRSYIDTYDVETGFYYRSVESERNAGFLSKAGSAITNLYIYDPRTKSGKLLFPEKDNFQIIALAFEQAVKDGAVQFHTSYSAPVKNNTGIERKPKSTMLILTRDAKTKKRTFYFSNKDGTDLVEGQSIDPGVDWHIDVKNSEVRLVGQVGKAFEIESFPW